MPVDLKRRVAFTAAVTLLAVGAQAQTTDSRDERNRQPPATDARFNLPGWMYTPFPVNGARAEPPKMNPFVVSGGVPLNIRPLNGTGAGSSPLNGGTTVIYQGGYGYPGYSGYPYGSAGQYGYESAPSAVTVVQTDASGRTRMSPSALFDGCAFPGYTTSFVSGQTVFSPFGAHAGCPRYVYARYVILGAAYPYLSGHDTNIVISPWAANDPYVSANESRGRTLGVALRDFSRFWEQSNAAGLRRRVQPDISVAVFDGERFLYSLRRVDFLALAADALDQVESVSFRFTDVRERSDGLVNAYALHTYRSRNDGTLHTVRVCYTLVYTGGDWYLSATSILP